MTDLDSYLAEIVDPYLAEFGEHRWSRRHGFIACVCLFHSVDYFPARPPGAPNRRETFGRASPDFSMVDRVAHAFKHEHTGDVRHPRIKPLRSGEIYSRPPAMAGVMMAGISRCGDLVGGVEIGGEDLYDIAERARAFIAERQLEMAGVQSNGSEP